MNCVPHDADYGRLKDDLIASTGLSFYADRDALLTDLIHARLAGLGLRDYSSYSKFLADGEMGIAEREILISQLTIGETSFFRDAEFFAALRDVILPAILIRNQSSRQLRIWSAGCATGAEPYSIEILLKQNFAEQIAGWNITIHATDLNRGYLAKAAEGKYRDWAVRYLSDEMKRSCFTHHGSAWTIHSRFKQWSRFQYLNLVDGDFSSVLPSGTLVDLILCRNVMIYFAPPVAARLISQFHACLENEGWLVVGGSECNVESYRAFRTVDANGARFYQKAARLPETVMEVLPPPLVESPTPPQRGVSDDLDILRQFTNRGDWQSAAEYSRKLLMRNKMDPSFHFFQALIFEYLGELSDSERSLRHAIYLDRTFALAHYHLGLALKRDGQQRAAARSFGNVLSVLAAMPDDATLRAGPHVSISGLMELARTHLATPSGS